MTLQKQARRESNPQPSVLETDALPIELLAYSFFYRYRKVELILFAPYLMNGMLTLIFTKLF
jgi:hypothetical protein